MPRRSTKWLYLPVEIQYRALDSKLLLACFASLRGYRTLVGEQVRLVRMLRYLPPGLYLDKSLARAKEEEFSGIAGMGHQIASLDEEGLSAYLPESYVRERFSARNLQMASAVFAWGAVEKNTIEGGYPDSAGKLHATGNPRVDIWRSEFKRIHAQKAAALKSRLGEFFLFPSNFGLPASPDRTGQVFNFLLNRGDLDSDDAIAFFFERLAHNTRVFSRTCTLIRDLSRRFPDRRFVVRPHPAEGDRYWKEKLQGCSDNVTIEHEGEVTPYIAACDALVHHGCTTAVEAFCMGKPTIAFLPNHSEAFDRHPSIVLSAAAEDEEAVARALSKITAGEFAPPPGAMEAARQTFANFETAGACEAILDVVDGIELKPAALPAGAGVRARALESKNTVLFSSFEAAMSLLQRVIPKYLAGYGSRYPKWPGCTIEDVKNKITLFSESAPALESVEATALSKNLFCVGPRPQGRP